MRPIAVKYNFLREHVDDGKEIMIQRVESKDLKAGVFTKGLPAEKFPLYQEVTRGMVIVFI